METLEKRRVVELALEAGRHYLSPQTNLIHYCYEDERSTDTIPLFENLCYILALFRSLIGDNVQEGKERVRHLLAYRLEDGRFPIYLHQYPTGYGSYRTMYPFFLIDKHFHRVIEEPLRSEIRKNLTLPLPPDEITSSREAGLMALHLTCHDKKLDSLAPYWDPNMQLYVGPFGDERQRKEEIETTLFDLFMGSSPRILKPHPVHLHASLVFPHDQITDFPKISHITPKPLGKGFHLYRKVWQEGEHLHTLICQEKKMTLKDNVFVYPEEKPEEKKGMEISFYTDYHPDTEIRINGEKGTVFKLGDLVTIHTATKTLTLSFEIGEGEGILLGHISRGNRPSQLLTHDFTAYDWKIGIRTLRRSKILRLSFSVDESGDHD